MEEQKMEVDRGKPPSSIMQIDFGRMVEEVFGHCLHDIYNINFIQQENKVTVACRFHITQYMRYQPQEYVCKGQENQDGFGRVLYCMTNADKISMFKRKNL